MRNNCQRILLHCMKIRFLGGFLRHNQEKVSLCNFFFYTFDFDPELHVEVIDLFFEKYSGKSNSDEFVANNLAKFKQKLCWV